MCLMPIGEMGRWEDGEYEALQKSRLKLICNYCGGKVENERYWVCEKCGLLLKKVVKEVVLEKNTFIGDKVKKYLE